MAERTTRGKLVRLRGIEINVHEDGAVHIGTAVTQLTLTEQQGLDLHRLLGDVIEYESED